MAGYPDPDRAREWLEQLRRQNEQRVEAIRQRSEAARQRLRARPGRRVLVYLGGLGTSIVALAALGAASMLFYGGATGRMPAGVPAVGFFVAGLIPLVYGIFVARVALIQFRMDDFDLFAPGAAAIVFIVPGLQLVGAFVDRSFAEVWPAVEVAAVLAIPVLMSLVGGLVLRREYRS
jgi:hypothetical protein